MSPDRNSSAGLSELADEVCDSVAKMLGRKREKAAGSPGIWKKFKIDLNSKLEKYRELNKNIEEMNKYMSLVKKTTQKVKLNFLDLGVPSSLMDNLSSSEQFSEGLLAQDLAFSSDSVEKVMGETLEHMSIIPQMGSVEGDLDSMLVSIVESGDDKQDDQIHEITSTGMKTRTKSTNEDKNV